AILVWPRRAAPAAHRAPAAQRPPARLAGVLSRRPAVAAGAAAALIVLIAAGASLSRQGLAQLYRDEAQSELARDPAAALADVERSLDIDADSAQTYYIRAAALARFNQAPAAEAALADALARAPRNFVTWTLLGDISVREGRLAVAGRYYARAHELNPRNPVVSQLASDPRAALR